MIDTQNEGDTKSGNAAQGRRDGKNGIEGGELTINQIFILPLPISAVAYIFYQKDFDDEYLEEYGSDDFADSADDAHDDEEPESDEGQPDDDTKDGKFTAPSIEEAQAALKSINSLPRPRRNTGAGYKKCDLPLYTCTRLEWMASFLHLYTSTNRPVQSDGTTITKTAVFCATDGATRPSMVRFTAFKDLLNIASAQVPTQS
ncbi:hypothetical protein FB451DRAFT_1177804 [Mycena latifolia]|nr:hypothetical protein FB451DRAFT_1177804 [Mycena latifolia]